jgi:iron complex transport system permease protein
LLGAVVAYLTITSGQVMRSIMFWLSGSFSLSQWSELQLVLPVTLIGSCFILLFGRSINIMQLDEEQAQQLGVNVERLKLVLLIVATLITAAAVSFVGIIGFVGIIIPHAVRLVWGPDYRFLLPLSMLRCHLLNPGRPASAHYAGAFRNPHRRDYRVGRSTFFSISAQAQS